MTDSAAALDQTAVLVGHAASWSQIQTMAEQTARPAVVSAVERWNRALNADPSYACPATTRPPNDTERHHLEAAARMALHLYPGPAGQLINRELSAAAAIGHTIVTADALLLRLAEQVLASSSHL